jgi:hypothetical protein
LVLLNPTLAGRLERIDGKGILQLNFFAGPTEARLQRS